MTSKSTFVVVVICGLFLAAVLARNGEILLLALPFLVYLIVGMLRCPDGLELRAKRMISTGEAAAEEPFTVQVEAENEGRLLTNLVLLDPIWPGMTIAEGTTEIRTALAPGQRAQLEYVGHGTRGLYRWTTIWARAGDPCALFEVNSQIPAFGDVRVRPAAVKLRRMVIKPRSTLHAPGPMPARLPGSGTDFWEVREYRPGDPLRRLNWRLAGRYTRRLFTNEYEGGGDRRLRLHPGRPPAHERTRCGRGAVRGVHFGSHVARRDLFEARESSSPSGFRGSARVPVSGLRQTPVEPCSTKSVAGRTEQKRAGAVSGVVPGPAVPQPVGAYHVQRG